MGFIGDINKLNKQAKEMKKDWDPGAQMQNAMAQMKAVNESMADASQAMTDGVAGTAQVVAVGASHRDGQYEPDDADRPARHRSRWHAPAGIEAVRRAHATLGQIAGRSHPTCHGQPVRSRGRGDNVGSAPGQLSYKKPPARDGRRVGRRVWQIVLWTSLGLVIALSVAAGGFYLWYRSEVAASNARVDPDVIAALEEPVTATTVAPLTAPDSMNIVLLGSDTRSTDGRGGRSDTIILVHIDTRNDFLSMLSLPRDLRVKIPERGYNKINAAYAYGGPALLIRTVQSAMGVDLDHYAETDFNGFKAITDSLGGVYLDVDRTYDDGKIQLAPGYQLLDGQNALRFCRTRHDKNIDFGRMQRQQRFITAVREQAMGWNLAFKMPTLISSTFANVDTDLSANDLIKLAWWAVGLDGSRMKMATLITSTGTIDGISFVLATEGQLTSAIDDFLTPPDTTPEDQQTDLEAASSEELLEAAQRLLPDNGRTQLDGSAWRNLADAAGFSLVAPTYLPPKCKYSYQRSYNIQVDGSAIPAVRVGYRLGTKDQYLGVGETTWLEAPLAVPGQRVAMDSAIFTIVGTNTKTDHIWWVEDGVLCWVANTLMYELSKEQLLAVAMSTAPVLTSD